MTGTRIADDGLFAGSGPRRNRRRPGRLALRLVFVFLAAAALFPAARPAAAAEKAGAGLGAAQEEKKGAKKIPLKKIAASGKKAGQLRWNKDWGPLVPHTTFPRDCSLCHVSRRWDVLREDFKFDHLKETGHKLEGAHADASCLRCHNDRGPARLFSARGCGGCHIDPHKSTMGRDCTRCHGQESWQLRTTQGRQVADHARTRFPLTGMHAVLRCDQCHLKANVTQRVLAKRLGVTQAYISKVEHQSKVTPKLLAKVKAALRR